MTDAFGCTRCQRYRDGAAGLRRASADLASRRRRPAGLARDPRRARHRVEIGKRANRQSCHRAKVTAKNVTGASRRFRGGVVLYNGMACHSGCRGSAARGWGSAALQPLHLFSGAVVGLFVLGTNEQCYLSMQDSVLRYFCRWHRVQPKASVMGHESSVMRKTPMTHDQ